MSVFDAVLIGALGMAALLFVLVIGIVMVWKVWPMLVGLTTATSELSDSIKQSISLLRSVRDELGLIRSMTHPAPPSDGDPGDPSTGDAFQAPKTKPRTPFPNPIYEQYPAVPEEPDATLEDTDSEGLVQTDEELVQIEKLDNLRAMGINVEDSDAPHDAIIADSE